jgi:hypothetical protein
VITLIDGRYLKTTTSDKTMAGIGDLCDVRKLLTSGGTTAKTSLAAFSLAMPQRYLTNGRRPPTASARSQP